jgi:hypothetical protein
MYAVRSANCGQANPHTAPCDNTTSCTNIPSFQVHHSSYFHAGCQPTPMNCQHAVSTNPNLTGRTTPHSLHDAAMLLLLPLPLLLPLLLLPLLRSNCRLCCCSCRCCRCYCRLCCCSCRCCRCYCRLCCCSCRCCCCCRCCRSVSLMPAAQHAGTNSRAAQYHTNAYA